MEKIKYLPGNKTDLFVRNMLDHYLDKPHKRFRQGKETEENVLHGIYL